MWEFSQNLLAYLIQECNRKFKELQLEVELKMKPPNIPHYRIYAVIINGEYYDTKIVEMVIVIDAEHKKYEYARNIVKSEAYDADFNIRNSF